MSLKPQLKEQENKEQREFNKDKNIRKKKIWKIIKKQIKILTQIRYCNLENNIKIY